jgi:hypothetical protein
VFEIGKPDIPLPNKIELLNPPVFVNEPIKIDERLFIVLSTLS